MRLRHLAAVGMIATAVALSGCAAVTSWTVGTATDLSTSVPGDATTLGGADNLADAVVNVTKGVVDSNKLNAGQLTELQALRKAVRTADDDLHADNDAGRSLVFSTFNAALHAWRDYKAEQGI